MAIFCLVEVVEAAALPGAERDPCVEYLRWPASGCLAFYIPFIGKFRRDGARKRYLIISKLSNETCFLSG
jgi:hypothetical protein